MGVGSMLNQYKSYSQTKKTPLQIPRPSVFSSPDEDEDEDEYDDAYYMEVKGNPTVLFKIHFYFLVSSLML